MTQSIVAISTCCDGQGYTVDGLYINRPNTDKIGLFGYVNSTIKNIGVTNLDIQGDKFVGGLVGHTLDSSYITNSYSSGNVSGDAEVGGLVGYHRDSNITKSYSTGSVNGGESVGGLVGANFGGSYITNSYSSGSVSGDRAVGGLLGKNYEGTVVDSFWNTETSTTIPQLSLARIYIITKNVVSRQATINSL